MVGMPAVLRQEWRFLFIFLWPSILAPLLVLGGSSMVPKCGFTVLLMAGYWVTEAIPIPVTALLPLVLYPLMGLESTDKLARNYMKDSIFAYIGSLTIAIAIEFCGLHKRIALRVILWTGTSVNMLMLGIMICTAFLSMWMSNTAVSAMMVPIISAVLDELEKSLVDIVSREKADCPPCGTNKTAEASSQGHKVEEEAGGKAYSCDDISLRPMGSINCNDVPGDEVSVEEHGVRTTTKSRHHFPTASTTSCNNAFNQLGESVGGFKRNDDIDGHPEDDKELERFLQRIRTMFLLSCCYSSNIGGTGVITGCGTNLVAMEYLGNLDPAHHGDYAALTFTTWMAFNLVPMSINVAVAWVYLQVCFVGVPDWCPRCLRTKRGGAKGDKGAKGVEVMLKDPRIQRNVKDMLERSYKALGGVSVHEKGVTACFSVALVLWIFRDPRFIPGWSSWFHKDVKVATASLMVTMLFFIVPRNGDFYRALRARDFTGVKFAPLLEWNFVVQKLPWGVLILLGGGFSLSAGAKKSGLSQWIGASLLTFSDLPPWAFLALICVMIAFLTEIASNSATATVLLPILLELSRELNIHPLFFTLPATIVCSYAFMLPAATPPNAIVYAATDMKVSDMVKAGFFMNCATVFVLYCCTLTYGEFIFHFSEYKYIE